jgi:phage terminase small subunit
LSATAAAVEAGYSRTSANKRGWYLLRRPEIREAVARLQKQRVCDEDISAKRTLEELRRVALADIRSLYSADGTLKPIHEWTAEQGSAVQEASIQLGPAGTRVLKVRFWDKTKALEMLAKHLQLLVERTEISGGLTISWLPPERADVVDAAPAPALPPPAVDGDVER